MRLVFITICTLDLMLTLWLVCAGLAVEANPVLAWTFDHHPVVFAFVKWISFAVPMLLIDRLLPQCARLWQQVVWSAATASYLAVYVGGTVMLHIR